MSVSVRQGLKTTFLAHAVTGVLFGVAYLVAPYAVGDLFGMTVQDAAGFRVLGAALIGYGASSWWASQAASWSEVRILVRMEIVWTVLGGLATGAAIMMGELPASGWLNAILLLGFAIAFGIFHGRHES